MRRKRRKARHLPKHLTVGPGGIGCPCCFPAPGSPGRRAEFRLAKKRECRAALKIEMQQMNDTP